MALQTKQEQEGGEGVFVKDEYRNINEKRVDFVDSEFDEAVRRDMKIMIAKAFISLEARMRDIRRDGSLSKMSISRIEKKASQMKQEIDSFIDSQVSRIIADSKVRKQNDSQVPE